MVRASRDLTFLLLTAVFTFLVAAWINAEELLHRGLDRVERTHADELLVVAAVEVVALGCLLAMRLRSLRAAYTDYRSEVAKRRTLEGMLAVCAWCKEIRTAEGSWEQLEGYISRHSDATFTHSICPSCEAKVLAGEFVSDTAGRP